MLGIIGKAKIVFLVLSLYIDIAEPIGAGFCPPDWVEIIGKNWHRNEGSQYTYSNAQDCNPGKELEFNGCPGTVTCHGGIWQPECPWGKSRVCKVPPAPKSSGGGGGCFPGNAMVTTPTGNVAMEMLSIGDSVLTVLDHEELGFTKVVGFAQRQTDKETNFLSITTVNQAGHSHTVRLTSTHNIYVKTPTDDDRHDYITRFAEDVFIADVVKTQTNNGTTLNEATVTNVKLLKEMGVFAPLTETGTMLVDGTLVSCYASFKDNLIHALMAPIRWFPWLFADAEKPLDGTLPYVEAWKYIARNYIAPIVSIN